MENEIGQWTIVCVFVCEWVYNNNNNRTQVDLTLRHVSHIWCDDLNWNSISFTATYTTSTASRQSDKQKRNKNVDLPQLVWPIVYN